MPLGLGIGFGIGPFGGKAGAVVKTDQTITFGALTDKYAADSPFAISATASSGLSVTFTSATPSVCTVAGSTVTLVTGGTCTINADQAGNGSYNAAPQVQQSFTAIAPNTLFSSGESGAIYDFTSLDGLFQDAAETTPVTTVGQYIRYAKDKSGTANHLKQTSTTYAPILAQDSDGTYYANFLNSRNLYSVGTFTPGTRYATLQVCMSKASSTNAVLVELGENSITQDGTFSMWGSLTGNTGFEYIVRATKYTGYTLNSWTGQNIYGVNACAYNMDGASASLQVMPWVNRKGYTLTAVTNGTITAQNFVTNRYLNIGAQDASNNNHANPFTGKIYGAVLIGRALTTTENVNLHRYLIRKAKMCYGICIGDSIVAENSAIVFSTPSFVEKFAPFILAVSGERISQQSTRWANLASDIKTSAEVVFIQIGINDIQLLTDSAATIIGRYQTLVNDVRAALSSTCKIILSTMTPARAAWIIAYGETDGEAAYQKWIAINTAITGGGGSPITGADAVVSSHTTTLNDGSGNLGASYDSGDHLHPNNTGRAVIGTAWRTALVSLSLLA